METQAQEKSLIKQLDELCQQLYATHERRIVPKYPWVFVKVLPKEQAPLGRIILPDGTGPKGQNKILYEGIVLETWKSFYEFHRSESTLVIEKSLEDWTRQYLLSKGVDLPVVCTYDHTVLRESSVKPGMHVIFPHYEGLPAGRIFDEKEYRLVREFNPSDPERRCEILGYLEYEQEKIEDAVLRAINECDDDAARIAARITKEFYVVRKSATPRTTSGV